MSEKDIEHLKELHIRWTDLHEEQASLVKELVRFPTADGQSAWGRYETVQDEKAKVMDQIRVLREKRARD